MHEQTNVKHHNTDHQWHGMQISKSITHHIVIINIFISSYYRATQRRANSLLRALAAAIHLQYDQQ